MNRVVIVGETEERIAWLTSCLIGTEFEVVSVLNWMDVDESSITVVPSDVILVDAAYINPEVLRQIIVLFSQIHSPVVVLDAQPEPFNIKVAIRAGASAYVAHSIKSADLRPILQVAVARSTEYRRLRHELKTARSELADRKLVDRAKGILINDHGYSEAEAYKNMRSLAMSKGKRIAKIAEAIIVAKKLRQINGAHF
jgi:response regulator NasT